MNVLLTSVGRRSYIVKYFKEVIGNSGEVHVSNSNNLTPAFSCADKSVVSPLIYDENYIDFLKNYCVENKINAIISLFDIDLPILSQHKDEFKAVGCEVLVSEYDFVSTCNDKWKTYNFLKANDFNVPKTYLNLHDFYASLKSNDIDFPVIVKPRWGMGSISVFEAENADELEILYEKIRKNITKTYLKYESIDLNNSVIIQEKLDGQEYGLDVINDLKGNYRATVIKEKIAMRAGETDCAKIVDVPSLRHIGEMLGNASKHIANCDCDVFISNGVPYVLELNARFGGGYPFSHLAGCNLPLAIINWLNNGDVPDDTFDAKIGMIGYKDLTIKGELSI